METWEKLQATSLSEPCGKLATSSEYYGQSLDPMDNASLRSVLLLPGMAVWGRVGADLLSGGVWHVPESP